MRNKNYPKTKKKSPKIIAVFGPSFIKTSKIIIETRKLCIPKILFELHDEKYIFLQKKVFSPRPLVSLVSLEFDQILISFLICLTKIQ